MMPAAVVVTRQLWAGAQLHLPARLHRGTAGSCTVFRVRVSSPATDEWPGAAGGSKSKPRGIMGKHGVMKYFTTPLASGAGAGRFSCQSGVAGSTMCTVLRTAVKRCIGTISNISMAHRPCLGTAFGVLHWPDARIFWSANGVRINPCGVTASFWNCAGGAGPSTTIKSSDTPSTAGGSSAPGGSSSHGE